MAHVRLAFTASGATYGAPRVHQELRAAGLPTSTKRVARLMRADGLVARPRRRRRVVTTDSNHHEPIAPNRLARAFDINGVAVNQVWVGDITYVPTREGFLYLATGPPSPDPSRPSPAHPSSDSLNGGGEFETITRWGISRDH